MKKENKYDLIVIGAGSGSLSAALHNVMDGKKVLLVEKSNQVGGYNSVVHLGRFSLDSDFRGIPAEFLGVNMQDELKNIGADVVGTVSDVAFRLIVTDGIKRDYLMPAGYEAFKAKLYELCPEAEESAERFFALVDETVKGLKALVNGAPFSKIKKEYPDYVRSLSYTLEEVEEYYDIPVRAREIINGYWLYLGLPPHKLDFSTYATYFYTYVSGVFKPDLGRADVDRAYLKAFKERGGVDLFNTEVKKITVKNGSAVGVVTDDGYENHSTYVLTELPDVYVYNSLIPAEKADKETMSIVNTEKHGANVFTLTLGLNCSFADLGLKAGAIVILPSSDNAVLERNMKELSIPSLICDLSVENGLSIIKLTSLYLGDTLESFTVEDRKNAEVKIADDYLRRFEEVLDVSVRPHIEEYAVFSPLYFAHSVSDYGGSPLGLEPTPHNSTYIRWNRKTLTEYVNNLDCVGVSGVINCFGSEYLSAAMTMNKLRRGKNE